ncbi:MAG TPA: hypothetical protein VGK22_18725 [Candidatus Angelobacter sp.]|jgi:hypothetical protein
MLKKIRTIFAVLIMAGFAGAVIPTQAIAATAVEDHCERKIHDAEARLQDAIAKHGEHSRQAEKRRHELEETRRHCEHH